MNCFECNLRANVIETRTRPDGSVRRRYQCSAPHASAPHARRFTTIERRIEQREPPANENHDTMQDAND